MKGIALVGPAGVGKTSVGKIVSRILNCPFIDLDQEIVCDTGKTITEIFAIGGEPEFRNSELAALTRVTQETAETLSVLATGGGLVVSPQSKKLLREWWTVVFLQGNVETLLMHLSDEGAKTRPLLSGGDDLAAKVRLLWEQRRPLYEQVATYIIHVDHRSPEEIAKQLIVTLESDNDFVKSFLKGGRGSGAY
ncbi:shikimate kinase [Alicyclobacillaceae bacterium I2511]|nr:shikimate kinase [Alicyclobacillaceae bacterium I2511]